MPAVKKNKTENIKIKGKKSKPEIEDEVKSEVVSSQVCKIRSNFFVFIEKTKILYSSLKKRFKRIKNQKRSMSTHRQRVLFSLNVFHMDFMKIKLENTLNSLVKFPECVSHVPEKLEAVKDSHLLNTQFQK